MCFGISEQEIEDALSNAKAAFSHGTTVGDKPANLEQCVKALNIAVDTLSKVRKDGKRTLNKDQNINLQKEVLDVYIELTQLQSYSGPGKAQKCFEFAAKWRNGMSVPGPIQPQPQPQPAVHGTGRFVDNASVSSGGSLSIPDQFYQAGSASKSSEIDSHDEDNSNWDTRISSRMALNVSSIHEPDGYPGDRTSSHPAKPREKYEKHTGCFADAAPRTAISDIERDYLDSSTQTKERDQDDRNVATVSSSTRIITGRTSTGEIRHIILGPFSGNAIRVITERTSTGELRMTPTNEGSGELRHVITERTESGAVRYVVGGTIASQPTTITRVILGPRIVSERTSTGETRYVIVDRYNGNAIRTKFEPDEKTGEYVHIPVKEPEGELRRVLEERTETGEIRKIIGDVVTGNVTTTTRVVPGGVGQEGGSNSSRIRIVRETDGDKTRYYQVTEGPDGQEVRTLVERTEDGGFRIPGGGVVVGAGATLTGSQNATSGGAATTPNKTQITIPIRIMRYERADASLVVPSAPAGTIIFNKFRIIAPGEVDIDDTAHSHAEETTAPNARRTVKWMKVEAHWKREAGMLQHLKSDRYLAEVLQLYSLPLRTDYRYVSIMGSFSRTLDSYMKTERLTSIQIRQLTASLSGALRWCHEHHVVHLNIRPVSFFLDGVLGQDATNGNGQLVWKLWNFGHSRFIGENVDTAITTVNYAAPEILNGRKNNDPNVLAAVSMDLWSLGLIIYELYARKPYFSSGAFAESQLTQDGGAKFEPNLDAVREQDAAQAVRGLLEVDPDRRYTLDDLRDVYSGKI
ncbi:protein kinase, AMP-activated, alpha 2 catalytic subunit [Mortierella sp. NVP85]|nr:protein kinase, AMP-activated, alpha 2 catalytic subunit [Mortierella sp. NVP85]